MRRRSRELGAGVTLVIGAMMVLSLAVGPRVEQQALRAGQGTQLGEDVGAGWLVAHGTASAPPA